MLTQASRSSARRDAARNPPMVSGGVPLLGHAVEFGRDTMGLLERARREGGDVVRFRLAHKDMYLLTGPAASEAFFRASDDQLSPHEAYKMMTPVFGKDVVYDAAPERTAEQLGMLRPALQDRRMRTYGEIVGREVDRSLDELGDAGT